MKNPFAVNLRFPEQGYSAQGQSVPKPRPKGVGDGQRVNIPVPLVGRDGVTQKGRQAGCWTSRCKPVDGSVGKSAEQAFMPRREVMPRSFGTEAVEPTLTGKTSKYTRVWPYRKPTQVGGESIPRRTREPLLRNSAKWPRNFGKRGAPSGETIYLSSWRESQIIGPGDCLLKTQDSAKP